MGKIKRNRQKLHQKAVKFADETTDDNPNESSLPAIFPVTGLFSAEDKSTDDSKTSLRSKKDKRKERHEKFIKKLHGTRAVEESLKKAEKRSKTVIVGDMEPLLAALPTILHTTHDKINKNQENTKKRNKLSKSSRQKMQIAEIEHFQRVLNHPAYQSNPVGAIAQHLKLAIQKETDGKT